MEMCNFGLMSPLTWENQKSCALWNKKEEKEPIQIVFSSNSTVTLQGV